MQLSREVLAEVLSAAPDSLLVLDPSGRIAYANAQAVRLFGWPAEELVGSDIDSLVPGGLLERDTEVRGVHPTGLGPAGAGLELTARCKDGREFPVEISLSTLRTAEGVLMTAAVRDASLTHQAEHRFRAVLASAPDAMVGVDARGRIQLVNGQMERLFGWTTTELVGQQIEVLVPAGLQARHAAHRDGYVRDPTTRPMGAGTLLSGRRKDGTEFPAEISLSAVEDGAREMLVLAAVRDVTERLEIEAERRLREIESQREQAHRLESLGQLAGGVAHDFNNLLGVILNYVALLEPQIEAEQPRADMQEIRAAAEHGARLTRQLLTFARRDVVVLAPVDVTDTVRSVASMLEGTVGERIELHLDLPAEEMTVLADRHQIEQILVNLVINARDALPEGGTVTLRVSAAVHPVPGRPTLARAVVVEVEDTGVGMTAETARRAFEPFFTTKARGRGTGLGLATAYGIVEAADGEITIDSTPGEGTAVRVLLPQSQDRVPVTDGAVGSSGGSELILLVEDEESLRRGTARLLRGHGYDVVEAADGVAALAVFDGDGKPPDLVLSDVAMPRMGGDELLRCLSGRGIPVPVVLMSGYDSGPVDVDHPVLEKPVTQAGLLRALREALDA